MNKNAITKTALFAIVFNFATILSAIAQETSRINSDGSKSRDKNVILLKFSVGLDRYEHLEQLPVLFPSGTITKQFTTYDPKGNNEDEQILSIYKKNGEAVFFDEYGPGVLYRQHSNLVDNWFEFYGMTPRDLSYNKLKYYFDNRSNPDVDINYFNFLNGENSNFFTKPFGKPYSFYEDRLYRYALNYYPFRFNDRLTVTLDSTASYNPFKEWGFIGGYTYQSFREDFDLETWKGPKEQSVLTETYWEPTNTLPSDLMACYAKYGFQGTLNVVDSGMYYFEIFLKNDSLKKFVSINKKLVHEFSANKNNEWELYKFDAYLNRGDNEIKINYGARAYLPNGNKPVFKYISWKKSTSKLGEDPKTSFANKKIEGNESVPAGKSKIILSVDSSGSIASLKIKMKPYDEKVFYNTKIKVFWDNENEPSVNMSIGDFFGSSNVKVLPEGYSKRKLENLMFGYDGKEGTCYCYWPMPFWKHAKIVIENNSNMGIDSLSYQIAYIPSELLKYDRIRCAYFKADKTVWSDTLKVKPLFVNLFQKSGRGHVVGRSLYMDGINMEGDEFTYIDDSKYPSMHGDGTEDDFNQGWGGGPFQKPLWGAMDRGFNSSYRLYIGDSYVFNKNICIQEEIYYNDRVPVLFSKYPTLSSVTYYYLSPNKNEIILTDSIDVGNMLSEKNHTYKISGVSWKGSKVDEYPGYDGGVDYYKQEDNGYDFDGYSEFKIKIMKDNDGVKLRKRINTKGNNRQIARVYVDGILMKKPWYILSRAKDSTDNCWMDTDIEIPPSLTKGKSKINVRVECDKLDGYTSKSKNNEYYYWVYSYPSK